MEAINGLIEFVRANQAWAAPIMFLLAFLESIAIFSLFIPAWGALITIGALVAASDLAFWPVWFAAVAGAVLGDALSYWFGFHFKDQARNMWPMSKYPDLLAKGEGFVARWGIPSIFIARFSGPLRATVPLAAGIFEMNHLKFQLSNVASAMLWASVLLVFGEGLAGGMNLIMPKS